MGRSLGVIRRRLPGGLAELVENLFPHRRLGDEIKIGVGIGLPAPAFEDAAGLTAAGIIAGARHGIAERNAFAELAVLLERTMGEALLVAQLDAGKIQHTVLHGSGDLLALAGPGALIKCCDDA